MTGVYQGQAMLPLYRELHRIALIMPLLQEANTCVLLLLIRSQIFVKCSINRRPILIRP